MTKINPYINLLGNCEEAFNHYKSVFKGEFLTLTRFSEMPPQEGATLAEEQGNKIMHVSLSIGKDAVVMGSDTGGEWASQTKVGNNITLSVTADSKDHANALFKGLSEGGKVTMPLADTFWGSYFGMCVDKFDIHWMVSFGNEMGA